MNPSVLGDFQNCIQCLFQTVVLGPLKFPSHTAAHGFRGPPRPRWSELRGLDILFSS